MTESIHDKWAEYKRQQLLSSLALQPSDLPGSLATDVEVASAVAAEATARTAAITTAIAALVNGAPGSLDTLNELAAALTADEGAAATLATLVGTKMPVVLHGATASTARPTSTVPVLWLGSVTPTNATNNDLLIDTTTPAFKVRLAGSFVALGGGTFLAKPAHAGTTAQVLAKLSNTDGDYDWAGTAALTNLNIARAVAPGAGAAGTSTEAMRADAQIELTSALYSLISGAASGMFSTAMPIGVYSVTPASSYTAAAMFGTGYMDLVPIVVSRACTLDRIAVDVTTGGAAGALFRLGLYAADAYGQPGALVVDGGTVATDVTGIRAVTVSQAITAGKYFVGAVSQVSNGTVVRKNASSGPVTIIPLASGATSFGSTSASGYFVSGVSAALPASAAGAAPTGPNSVIGGIRASA